MGISPKKLDNLSDEDGSPTFTLYENKCTSEIACYLEMLFDQSVKNIRMEKFSWGFKTLDINCPNNNDIGVTSKGQLKT